MYEEGAIGLPLDYTMAVYWHKKAAAQGNTRSEKKLGELDANGVIKPQSDYDQAEHWIKAIQYKKLN
jgi:TPR repeat protein